MTILRISSPSLAVETIPLFVYGTLRSGGDLHALLLPHVRSQCVPARIPGMLARASAGDWPVLLPGPAGEPERFVRGEVYLVEQEGLNVLTAEELLFGYSLEWREVATDDGVGFAITCTWPWMDGFEEVIEHGDWLRYVKER